jgi:hypothetical protein
MDTVPLRLGFALGTLHLLILFSMRVAITIFPDNLWIIVKGSTATCLRFRDGIASRYRPLHAPDGKVLAMFQGLCHAGTMLSLGVIASREAKGILSDRSAPSSP